MNEVTMESVEEKPPIAWRTILVPVDLSDLSREAIRVAVCVAEQWHAKIILLHVVDLSNARVSFASGLVATVTMDCAQGCLDRIANEIPATVASEKLVCLTGGGVPQKIVEVACQISSDLIVLATRSHGLFKEILFGSTAEGVSRQAPCEVLVIRDKRNDP